MGAVDPDLGERGDAVELQLDMFAPVRGIHREGAPVPADAARPVALGEIGGLVKRPLHRPVVRQPNLPPGGTIIIRRRRSARRARFRVHVGRVMPADDRERYVPEMKAPAVVQR